MKKMMKTLTLALVLVLALCVGVFAAEPTTDGIYNLDVAEGYTVTPNTNAAAEDITIEGGVVENFFPDAFKMTVSYAETNAANFHMVFALNDATGVPTESNLVYIDQTSAEEGKVDFTVYPSELVDGVTYNVYVVGTELDLTKIASFTYYEHEELPPAPTGVATFGGTGYDSLAAAIAAAEAAGGGTVQLIADATEGMMMLSTGVTVDVNGKTLTTDGAMSFGGYIVDTSADNSGKVICMQGMLIPAATNPDLVVWNGTDGYIFTEIEQVLTQKDTSVAGKYKLTFLPRFTQIAKIAPLLADNGGEDHGVDIKVKLLWNGGEKELTYSDDMIKTVYGGNAFTVTLTGYEAFLDLGLKLQVVVEANGVIAASDPITVQ